MYIWIFTVHACKISFKRYKNSSNSLEMSEAYEEPEKRLKTLMNHAGSKQRKTADTHFWLLGFCWCCGNHRLDCQPLFGKMNQHSGNWAYGNHCWFAFVLWCEDHSASFLLHVNVHHFVIAPACNAKKLQPYFFNINLSMLNCTKVKVFNKKCVQTLVDKE